MTPEVLNHVSALLAGALAGVFSAPYPLTLAWVKRVNPERAGRRVFVKHKNKVSVILSYWHSLAGGSSRLMD